MRRTVIGKTPPWYLGFCNNREGKQPENGIKKKRWRDPLFALLSLVVLLSLKAFQIWIFGLALFFCALVGFPAIDWAGGEREGYVRQQKLSLSHTHSSTTYI